VTVRGSDFGEMLFDSRRQAIYVFEKDPTARPCATTGALRCHNVNLNGGFWWVVGADGRRLA
jgi:hypothetical protein